MNNDPNNINTTPIENLEPEVLDQPVQPVEPVTPESMGAQPAVEPVPTTPETLEAAPAVEPVPVVPNQLEQPQPVEPQMGTNPHQHVDMNSLTPRTVFDTDVKEPETKKAEAPKVENGQPAPKEKSTALPLILFLLVLAAGGYFLYTQFSPKPDESVYEKPQEEVEKEEKEETTDKEETKKEETKEETKEEAEKKEPAPQESQQPSQPAQEPSQPSQPAEPTPSAPAELEMIPGMIIYLYEGGGIGVDEFYAEYISHTDTDIKVKITLRETDVKEYTIKFGEKTKISGVKNQIVIKKATDNFPIEFK